MARTPGFRWLAGAAVSILAGASWSAAAQEPTKADEMAAGRAEAVFSRYCAACHGAAADGKGVLAGELRTKVPDLRELAKKNKGSFPFARVVRSIDGRETVRAHGSPDMPAWGDALKNTEGRGAPTVEEAIANLAHYIWTLQTK